MDFNVCDVFKFKIEGKESFVNFLEKEYSYFKSDRKIKKFDLKVFLGEAPSRKKYSIVEWVSVSKNFVSIDTKYKFVKWKVAIENFEDIPTIYFEPGKFGKYILENILETQIIQPLMQISLAKKGFSIIRASGISLEGSGIIFAGGKGTGKTSCVINMKRKFNKAHYLGDEYVVLGKGRVHSFPTPIHISNCHLNQKDIYNKLNFSEKLDILIKETTNKLTRGYINVPLYLSPERLFEVKKNADPKILFLLNMCHNESGVCFEIKKARKRDLVSKLVKLNRLQHDYFYSKMLPAYSYFFSNNKIEKSQKIVKKTMAKNLKNIECFHAKIQKGRIGDSLELIGDFLEEKLNE